LAVNSRWWREPGGRVTHLSMPRYWDLKSYHLNQLLSCTKKYIVLFLALNSIFLNYATIGFLDITSQKIEIPDPTCAPQYKDMIFDDQRFPTLCAFSSGIFENVLFSNPLLRRTAPVYPNRRYRRSMRSSRNKCRLENRQATSLLHTSRSFPMTVGLLVVPTI
jgi:hypothetical protein